MGLGQAEQLRPLCVDMYSCLYSTVKLPGASLASVEVSLTLVYKFETDKQIHCGVCRVASATKKAKTPTLFGGLSGNYIVD